MSNLFQQRLERFRDVEPLLQLRALRRGIEKEALRVDARGYLAQTPHPRSLGSALTHPQITTDFAEPLLEFITGVHTEIAPTLTELETIHRFVYQNLGDEQLWTASMPCILAGDDTIPLAQYGSSNVAQMKTAYRRGLGYRYGRVMQTIAGIHYNFSLPERLWPLLAEGGMDPDNADQLQAFRTERYFSLIRNFRRWSWLLNYLFGASPALCRSFLIGRSHQLEPLDDHSYHLPYATSLRMGDLGYQSHAQESLEICYNSLPNYLDTLRSAIIEPHPAYEEIGVNVAGEYRQLSAGLLQIENEFYSPIRPKRVARSGETALGALKRGGVEYIEVRCLDIDPSLPLGIDATTIRFLDSFLLYCLLEDSPPCDDAERAEIKANLKAVVNEGRKPGLSLARRGETLPMTDWANELLAGVEQVAERLDRAEGGTAHRDSCAAQRAKVADARQTPSARILTALREQNISWFDYAMAQCRKHRETFQARPLDSSTAQYFSDLAARSLADQAEVEAADEQPFADYLAAYFQQYRDLPLSSEQ